jgi:hypothetical protein
MKVNPKIEDAFLPMYEDDIIPLEEIKKKRDRYWAMLRRAKNEYLSLVDGTEYNDGINGFYYFMQQNYGLQPELIDGNLGSTYNIVDEKKYLLFLLKYGS